jgi:hypothetical protein
VTLLPIARGLVRPLLSAAAAALLSTVVRELIPGTAVVQLAATAVVGLATYALLVVPAEQRRTFIAQGRERLRAQRVRNSVTPAVAGAPTAEGAHQPAHLRRDAGGQP